MKPEDGDKLTPSCPKNRIGRKKNESDPQRETESPSLTKTRYGRKVVAVVPLTYGHQSRKKSAEVSSEEDTSDSDTPNGIEPPLFENDVVGSEVFGFRTPKSKAAMMELANSMKKTLLVSDKDLNESDDSVDDASHKSRGSKQVLSSPIKANLVKRNGTSKKDNTPIKRSNSHNGNTPQRKNTPAKGSQAQVTPIKGKEVNQPSTPYSLRARAKLGMIHDEEDDNMFALTDSEYDPSESSSSESDTEDEEETDVHNPPQQPEALPVRNVRRRLPGRKSEFVLTSDEYFGRRSGHKATSNNTLSNAGPRMNTSQVNSLLSSYTPTHQTAIKIMNKNICVFFRRWLFSLNMGYNIVVYGVGSKKSLLNSFYKQYLSSSLVLVVNGFFPGLTMKEIESNCRELLNLKGCASGESLCSLIGDSGKKVFLLIHNIDGEPLRSDRFQTFFSTLAGLPNVHLVASIDHINAPLLWDQKKLSKFNFVWEDGTTFLPYEEETSFESSLMIQGTGNMALAALKNVMKSLTNNQKKIFNILMDYHIDSSGRSQGMSFSALYHTCRADFIVSSDLALRTLLTEFLDHELVKWKKETDVLTVTLDVQTLKMYKSELEED